MFLVLVPAGSGWFMQRGGSCVPSRSPLLFSENHRLEPIPRSPAHCFNLFYFESPFVDYYTVKPPIFGRNIPKALST